MQSIPVYAIIVLKKMLKENELIDLILASSSPRRSELMHRMGYKFHIESPQVDETFDSAFSPVEAVQYLAQKKAKSIAKAFPNSQIVAADTIVVLNDEILTKPMDEKQAYDTLKKLSGNVHEVLTAICVMNSDSIDLQYESTKIWFKTLSDEDIHKYISSGEPMDKAGAYAIQGYAGLFITSIKGCYYNVMGLPMSRLYNMLLKIGIKPVFSKRDKIIYGGSNAKKI